MLLLCIGNVFFFLLLGNRDFRKRTPDFFFLFPVPSFAHEVAPENQYPNFFFCSAPGLKTTSKPILFTARPKIPPIPQHLNTPDVFFLGWVAHGRLKWEGFFFPGWVARGRLTWEFGSDPSHMIITIWRCCRICQLFNVFIDNLRFWRNSGYPEFFNY